MEVFLEEGMSDEEASISPSRFSRFLVTRAVCTIDSIDLTCLHANHRRHMSFGKHPATCRWDKKHCRETERTLNPILSK